ncbi:alkaline ceramidase ydc1 [Microsporum audouinii]
MVAYGLSTFLGGFAIWNLDNEYCSNLRTWRRELGLPWGILLEGHGWWHLLTGIGAYMYITWGIWLRHCLNGRQDDYRLHWPRLYNAADIVRVQDTSKPSTPEGYAEKLN